MLFKKYLVILGLIAISAIPCFAKSVNGIESNARQHVITPSPFYNGVYNNNYYTTSCYKTRKIKTKDENGKTVVIKEKIPCGSGKYGYGGGYYGLNYNPGVYTKIYHPYSPSSLGVGTSLKINF